MADRLLGKTALITGAAQGIGNACAELFVKEGAFVFGSDINDDLGLKVTHDMGAQAHYLHLDVQKEEDWNAAIEQIIQQRKNFDLLINNAGITGFQEGFGSQDPENASLDSWRDGVTKEKSQPVIPTGVEEDSDSMVIVLAKAGGVPPEIAIDETCKMMGLSETPVFTSLIAHDKVLTVLISPLSVLSVT